MDVHSQSIHCRSEVVIIALVFLTPVGSSFIHFNFLHNSDLSGHHIDLTATNEIQNVRILPQCSFYCDGICHMFAYHAAAQTCSLYDTPVLSSIPTTGGYSGLQFYSRKECPIGMYRNFTQCVSCAAGTYKNFTGEDSCPLCPMTYYQDEPGQTGCKQCQNTTEWRFGSNTDRTGCWRCWYKLNAYTEGDMSKVIRSIITTSPSQCSRECDSTPTCLLYTMRTDQGKCYLHYSKAFTWGYNPLSAIYKTRC